MSAVDALHLALWDASKAGDIVAAREALAAGAQADLEVPAGWRDGTPLVAAASAGHLDVVTLLITEAKADPDKPNAEGTPPLIFAARRGHFQVVQFLVQAGAYVDPVDRGAWTAEQGVTPLFLACQEGFLNVARLLVEARADIHKGKYDGAGAMHVACQRGHLSIVKFLVSLNCSVEDTARHGATPLAMAAYRGHLPVVEYLLEQGADRDRPLGVCKETAVDLACTMGHVKVIRFLVGGRGMLDPVSEETLLRCSAACGPDMARWLRGVVGWTPLHFACEEGLVKSILLLLCRGADLLAVARDGRTTPYSLILTRFSVELRQLFRTTCLLLLRTLPNELVGLVLCCIPTGPCLFASCGIPVNFGDD